MSTNQIIAVALAYVGAIYMLIAAIGIVRMPDFYLRLHCNTKCSTLGVGCLLLAAAFHFNDVAIWVRCLAAILFVLVTAPVGAQMIARAGHRARVKLAEETLGDELSERRGARPTPRPAPR